ncbi:bifunctional 4-hydroxy-2-oxoglutarate aldolase/2-dehydro-3-deoxy-phosphogluconate aldolase [Natronospirillum operosum]|uniref:2-dehydro-3-deoxy-phosphogluconate aldolase n=1 Tax=Natronospirillum operosum TaxID=2759953 RepID=A0A4Z0W9P5_9GAMM|nr:bifunctional 4-hydroxy-2-oxoglutarate aldolase/2-dehydro-3-deoxy-phosphogluconate aldolase [Natronospirillum operosum]TGG92863.1 bifunctional 4-hydroxy-2-oxoglutarate aldolase/2-dehydro-3-deoxy-phosphogluconate aldolase [Natronospirillum operosum]
MSSKIKEILARSNPVMPVLAVENVEDAVPLAEALKRGGLTVLEVTLRTKAAFEVIKAMKQVEGVTVGAGTLTNVGQLRDLEALGTDFAVSPGSTPQLLEVGRLSSVPYLPAVSTASEILKGMEVGYDCFKFFPAAVSGGVSALKAFYGPLPNLQFCPTGGISASNFREYLALPNVACVGGSWIVPGEALKKRDWGQIEALARQAKASANAG